MGNRPTVFRTGLRIAAEAVRVGRLLPPRSYARWLRSAASAAPTAVREKSLGPVDRAFGGEFKITHNGKEIAFRDTDFGVVREIFGQRCYGGAEELGESLHILDLGANVGVFSVYALALAPRAFVQAVEAQEGLCERWQQNVAQFGANSRAAIACSLVGGDTPWAVAEGKKTPGLQKFDVGQYVDRVGICDFLKCDIEGSEFGLFTPRSTWLTHVKRLAIEVHPSFGSPQDLMAIFQSHGFRCRYQEHGTLGYIFGHQFRRQRSVAAE